jgi:hypothetical protein
MCVLCPSFSGIKSNYHKAMSYCFVFVDSGFFLSELDLSFSSLQNEDRTLWKLGTLPPGLITFYNLTYPLDRGWHVLGLGYDPALNLTEIDNAAVVHYNGNFKPWLNLAVSKYKSYWSKYVMFDNPYLQVCNLRK